MIPQQMNLVKDLDNLERVPTRNGYGEGMVLAGEKNENVVVLCADLTESTRSLAFKEKFPERFVEMGVAEQNLATVASGMAAMGKIPYISSYAVFSPGRNWEQIRTTIAYNNQPVKIGGAHAGISVGPDGATHQALEDVSIMRVLPGMTVIVACDAIEARKATVAAANINGPVYLRFAREKTPVVTTDKTPFVVGKAEIFWDDPNADVAIIAMGPMVYEALQAAKALKKEGINVTVVNNHTVKPMDEKTIKAVAHRCGAVVTAEEHQRKGGLGSAVAEVLSQSVPVPMKMVGVDDRFGESGLPDELMKKFGLVAKDIVKAVKDVRVLREKRENVCDVMTETPSFKGKLPKQPKESHFYLYGGGTIKSIKQLKQAVGNMSNHTFSHHVTDSRNDFASWVRDVFNEKQLANQIKKCKSKDELMSLLKKK